MSEHTVNGVHSRSLVFVGALVSYVALASPHSVSLEHFRLFLVVGEIDSHWLPLEQAGLRLAQRLSLFFVGASVSYSLDESHSFSLVQMRLLVFVGASSSYWLLVQALNVLHTRSCVVVGETDWN